MAQEQEGLIENVFKLLDRLPSEFQTWVIVVLLIGGGIWWWRKNSEEKKSESSTKTTGNVTIGGNATNNIIQTGDNNQANTTDK